jgi:hypothetical protein
VEKTMSNTTIYAKMEKVDQALRSGSRIKNGIMRKRMHRRLLSRMFREYGALLDVSTLIRPKQFLTNGDRNDEKKVIEAVGGISKLRENAEIVKDAVEKAEEEASNTQEQIHSVRGSLVIKEKSFKEGLRLLTIPISIAGIACAALSIVGFVQEKWTMAGIGLGGISVISASIAAFDYFFNVKTGKVRETVALVKENLAQVHENLRDLIKETEM